MAQIDAKQIKNLPASAPAVPTTMTASLIVPAWSQMSAHEEIKVGAGLEIILEEGSVLVMA